MEKPKIIVFTTSYYPFMGGAEVAIQEITKRLKERFDFCIVTSRFRRDLPKRETRPEGTIVRIGFGGRLDKYLLIFAPFYYRDPASIVLGVDIGQGTLAAAIYKLLHPRTFFVLNIQYGEGDKRVAQGRLGAINLALRFMLGWADYVTAISSYLLNLSRRYGYNGPGEVIHNGVDFSKFKNKNEKIKTTNQNSKTIITTSRLVPKNGVDILIKAIAEVKKSIPDIQLHIIGDGEERKNLELQVVGGGLEENVKFFGSVPYEKIPEYLHRADVFVRPSRSEGMGNSFVEALAAGLPIVGTPVGGILDIIEDSNTGLFCNPEDPQDLAEKIIHLLEDRDLGKKIAENGGRMVEERFSWDKIAETYGSLFQAKLETCAKLSLKQYKPMSILIATPLLPPQLGGPAQYAHNLAREFAALGQKVKVVSFTKYLKFPSIVRHLLYLSALFKNGLKANIIFALDYASVGVPAAIASMILRKPLVIRVEGDFLWESFVERTRRDITLIEFYQNPPKLNSKERLVKWLSGWVMRRADRLAFSSEWRRDMIIDAYKIPIEETEIVHNAFPFTKEPDQSRRLAVILWAGRMLYLKNLHRLIRAFAGINAPSYELHLIGDGPERKNLEKLVNKYRAEKRIKFFPPMSHREVVEKVAEARAVVLPSLSDVGPNIVAEAIANLTPVLMTKESGYAEIFRDNLILIDPLDEADLREKLEKFIKYPAERTFTQEAVVKGWHSTAKRWIELFYKV